MALTGLVLSIISVAFYSQSLPCPSVAGCWLWSLYSFRRCAPLYHFQRFFPLLPLIPHLYFTFLTSEMEFISCPRSARVAVLGASRRKRRCGNGGVIVPHILPSQLARSAVPRLPPWCGFLLPVAWSSIVISSLPSSLSLPHFCLPTVSSCPCTALLLLSVFFRLYELLHCWQNKSRTLLLSSV